MRIREAELSDLDQLSKLFDSYRMFYGKESDINISKKFLKNRLRDGCAMPVASAKLEIPPH